MSYPFSLHGLLLPHHSKGLRDLRQIRRSTYTFRTCRSYVWIVYQTRGLARPPRSLIDPSEQEVSKSPSYLAISRSYSLSRPERYHLQRRNHHHPSTHQLPRQRQNHLEVDWRGRPHHSHRLSQRAFWTELRRHILSGLA